MTTTQPAALPELPGAFGYLCDWGNDSFGLTRQTVYYDEPGSATLDDWNEYPKVHENQPLYTADQMRAYALAALQPQPAAAVSDAEIRSVWLATADQIPHCEHYLHFARAILALRPQAVPMTDGWSWLTEANIDAYLEDYEMRGEGEDGRDACYTPTEGDRALLKDFVMGLLTEAQESAHHGITAQGAQGGEVE